MSTGPTPTGPNGRCRRVQDRKQLIAEDEAATVRCLFNHHLELGSARDLAAEAAATGLRGQNDRPTQGKPFGRGNLYHLLPNPIDIGRTKPLKEIHDGEHAPLIDAVLFARVQKLLADKAASLSKRRDCDLALPGCHPVGRPVLQNRH